MLHPSGLLCLSSQLLSAVQSSWWSLCRCLEQTLDTSALLTTHSQRSCYQKHSTFSGTLYILFPISSLWYIPLAGKRVIKPGEWPLSASAKYAGKKSDVSREDISSSDLTGRESLECPICLSQVIQRHLYVSLNVPLGKWEGTSGATVSKWICISHLNPREVFSGCTLSPRKTEIICFELVQATLSEITPIILKWWLA